VSNCQGKRQLTIDHQVGQITEEIGKTTEHNKFLQDWQIQIENVGQSWNLEEAIQTGKAVAVSDGSYMEVIGTTAWTIEAHTARDCIIGMGYTPGKVEDQSTYQSKLFGLWGILLTLLWFTKEHGINHRGVTIACNRLLALKQAQYQGLTDPNNAHYNIIGAIHRIRDQLPIKITFEHVKGHQDNGQSLALSWTAWMNIKMDARAKQWAGTSFQGPDQYTIPYKGWKCAIHGYCVIKKLQTMLHEHINRIALQQHWASKNCYSKGTAYMVDWDAADQAMRTLPQAHRRWVTKSAAKFLPYGQNMKRWKLRSSTTCPPCPQCQALEETKQHIFQCQATESKMQWDMVITSLDKWMKAQNTHPGIWHDIIEGLSRWQEGHESSKNPQTMAAQEQTLLGWELMMEGVISKQWRETQATYWKVHKSRKSRKQWTAAIIQKLLQVAWDMWHHRNQVLHHSEINQGNIVEYDTNQQIWAIYNQGLGSFPCDVMAVLKRKVTNLIDLPLAYKQQWIETALLAQK